MLFPGIKHVGAVISIIVVILSRHPMVLSV